MFRSEFTCTLGILLVLTLTTLAAGCGGDNGPTQPGPADVGPGRAVSLDGEGDRVLVPESRNTYDFIHGTGVFTVEAWIRLSEPDDDKLFGIAGNTWTNREYGFFFGFENRDGVADQQLRLSVMAGRNVVSVYSSPKVITDTEWHHVAAVGDGGEAKLYVDGVEVGDSNDMANFGQTASSRDLMIGDMYSATAGAEWFFYGELDEVRIWDVERSRDDLNATRGKRLAREDYESDAKGLVGYWRFDKLESLSSGNAGNNDVRDLAVNGRHGDLQGDATLAQSRAF